MRNNIYFPRDLADALEQISRNKFIPFAGGTDFMVKNKRHGGLIVNPKSPLIFLSRLPELKGLLKKNNVISIGSSTTFSEILEHRDLSPAFLHSCLEIATIGIRNVATLGGNICNASPAADVLPALYCLNAGVVVKSRGEEHLIPIENFITGPGKTVLKDNELLTAVRFEKQSFPKEIFQKIGTRKANALSKLSFCGMVKVEKDIVKDLRISFGAVAPTVVRSRVLEKEIIGKNNSWLKTNIGSIIANYNELIYPIDDQRSNAEYRRKVSINILEDFLLNEIWSI